MGIQEKCLRHVPLIPRWNRGQRTQPGFWMMRDPHNPSDSSATPHDRYIPALDGLRGIAATLMAGGTA
jgi:hypothetical protein